MMTYTAVSQSVSQQRRLEDLTTSNKLRVDYADEFVVYTLDAWLHCKVVTMLNG